MTENPVQHSKTKHIEVRHHFIRDHVEKGNINLAKVHTNDNVANILTKAMDEKRFELLRAMLGMINIPK